MKTAKMTQFLYNIHELTKYGLRVRMPQNEAVPQYDFEARLHVLQNLAIAQIGPVRGDNNHGAEETCLSLAQTDRVYFLLELLDVLYEEFTVCVCDFAAVAHEVFAVNQDGHLDQGDLEDCRLEENDLILVRDAFEAGDGFSEAAHFADLLLEANGEPVEQQVGGIYRAGHREVSMIWVETAE